MGGFWGSPNVLSSEEELFVRGVFADIDHVAKGYYDVDWGWWTRLTEGSDLTGKQAAKDLSNQIRKIGMDVLKAKRDQILTALGFTSPKFVKLVPWLQFAAKTHDYLRWKNRASTGSKWSPATSSIHGQTPWARAIRPKVAVWSTTCVKNMRRFETGHILKKSMAQGTRRSARTHDGS